jgi:uncharacterized protein YjbI with pentapeptide repeats
MPGVDCAGVDFSGSDLRGVDLSRANLRGANLSDCLLSWAWLYGTDLRDAILEHTQFDGTEFIETKVYNSHRYHLGSLEGAKVKDVDPSPDASGLKQSGVEALQFLQAS